MTSAQRWMRKHDLIVLHLTGMRNRDIAYRLKMSCNLVNVLLFHWRQTNGRLA